MHMAPVAVVFGRVIAKQTQVKKIGGARQKFERRKVSLVERSGIGPDPADTVFFHEPDKLRSMPAGMAKFNREPEIPWQLRNEFAQRIFTIGRRQRWRELNKDHLQLWRQGFDCAEERN